MAAEGIKHQNGKKQIMNLNCIAQQSDNRC
jgi:hypothetical protein